MGAGSNEDGAEVRAISEVIGHLLGLARISHGASHTGLELETQKRALANLPELPVE